MRRISLCHNEFSHEIRAVATICKPVFWLSRFSKEKSDIRRRHPFDP
ncbi:MAG: hypothetical protein MI757_21515 [Pirellulales bacterium]|nr:hypothetical protein [Pirellulales bacterium]